jgi:hypothetical protein
VLSGGFRKSRDARRTASIASRHDGEQVLTGKAMLATPGDASDPQRVIAGGRMPLGRDMTPGEYVLQVIVTDKLVKSKFKTATQSMDFEIEP